VTLHPLASLQNSTGPWSSYVLSFGTMRRRRITLLKQLSQAMATVRIDGKSSRRHVNAPAVPEVVVWSSLFGPQLESTIAGALLVVSPSLFFGNTFPSYMRIVQCINHGVAVVVDTGNTDAERYPWDSDGDSEVSDPLARIMRWLGGVYFASYDDLVNESLSLLSDLSNTRLNAVQIDRWRRYRSQLFAWDGTKQALAALYAVPT
jgi:hypothetical protein